VADLAADTIDSLPAARPGRRGRAQELARDAIEKMGDPTASPEERDQRRRRLTKGPIEFRAARVDQLKAKRKWARRATTIKARWSISLRASYATKQWGSRKAPLTLKEGILFNIAATCVTELSECDYSAEVEIDGLKAKAKWRSTTQRGSHDFSFDRGLNYRRRRRDLLLGHRQVRHR
jgi:hypothetical protein